MQESGILLSLLYIFGLAIAVLLPAGLSLFLIRIFREN